MTTKQELIDFLIKMEREIKKKAKKLGNTSGGDFIHEILSIKSSINVYMEYKKQLQLLIKQSENKDD